MSVTLEQEEILSHARECFGSRCSIVDIQRFVGGVRKQTYVVRLADPEMTCLLYLWNNEGNYFAERVAAGFEASQTDDVAPALFKAHTAFLRELGVNVPGLLGFGRLESGHWFAFVERIEGSDYDSFAAHASRAERDVVLERFADQVRCMHARERSYAGGALSDQPDVPIAPHDWTLAAAGVKVAAAAGPHPEVAARQAEIEARLEQLHAHVRGRTSYRLIHGELDPGHVLVRASDHAVYLVDIEGLKFNDVESEHTLLQGRYSAEDYRFLARDDLDPARMEFYKFAMLVSLLYAGSRLMSGGHPARELARNIFFGAWAGIVDAL